MSNFHELLGCLIVIPNDIKYDPELSSLSLRGSDCMVRAMVLRLTPDAVEGRQSPTTIPRQFCLTCV